MTGRRNARANIGGTPVSRGRQPKETIRVYLDRDVLAHYRGTGRGWQSRINDVLRKAAKLPVEKRKKA